jgi:transposase
MRCMNPVIGLDVSKGESMAQAFLDKGRPCGKVFRFEHTNQGLGRLRDYMKDLENETGKPPTIVLEATGHYHTPLLPLFEELGYVYLVINPPALQDGAKTESA